MSSSFFKGAVDLSKIGQQQEERGTDSVVNLYDSEVDAMHKLVSQLQQKAKGREVDLDDFQKEIKERFLELGFVVDVKWYQVEGERYKVPKIEILKRTEKVEFDHGQQAHEVTHDLLGLNEGGQIKVDRDMAKALEEGSFYGEKHKH